MLRDLKGIIDFGLKYENGERNLMVIGYSDNDFADDVEDKKSTTR